MNRNLGEMMNEAQREWHREAQTYQEDNPLCYHCGNPCSGDTTETVMIEDCSVEVPICDDPDNCPNNLTVP